MFLRKTAIFEISEILEIVWDDRKSLMRNNNYRGGRGGSNGYRRPFNNIETVTYKIFDPTERRHCLYQAEGNLEIGYAVPRACSILGVPYYPEMGLRFKNTFVDLDSRPTRDYLIYTLAEAPSERFQCGMDVLTIYVHEDSFSAPGKPVFVIEADEVKDVIAYYLRAKRRENEIGDDWLILTESQGVISNSALCSEIDGNNVLLKLNDGSDVPIDDQPDQAIQVSVGDPENPNLVTVNVFYEDQAFQVTAPGTLGVEDLLFILGVSDPFNRNISTTTCCSVTPDTLLSDITSGVTIQ